MNHTRTPGPRRGDLLAAKRAARNGDLADCLTFLAEALRIATDPARALTMVQLQEVCVLVAGEIDNVVRLGTQPGAEND